MFAESPDPSGHLNWSFNNATILFYLHLLRLVPSALYAWHRYVVTAVDLSNPSAHFLARGEKGKQENHTSINIINIIIIIIITNA